MTSKRSLPLAFEEPSTTFGERVAYARETRGLKQKDLAAKSGIDQTTISGWETGRRAEAKAGDALRLARVLRVSVEWLVEGIGAGPNESGDLDVGLISLPIIKLHPNHKPDPIDIRPAFARRMGYPTTQLVASAMDGDALEPDIRDGDPLIIELDTRVRDGFLLLQSGDNMLVRRVTRRPDGLLDITPGGTVAPAAITVIGYVRKVWTEVR
jgi:transcriptional regulator with XRE-family HTH domain